MYISFEKSDQEQNSASSFDIIPDSTYFMKVDEYDY
jgi:hypothetical protein